MASIYSSADGERRIPPEATTLAEVLKNNGYATAGFCAGNVYISSFHGYQRGFDLFQDFLDLESGAERSREAEGKFVSARRLVRRALEESGRYDPAFVLFSSALRGKKNIADMAKSERAHPFEGGETVNEHASAWLSRPRNGPFFLWLHYMDVHFPYLPRVPRHRLSDYRRFALSLVCLLFKRYSYPRRVMVDLYDDRIRDVDKIIARLLAWLKDQGLYDDTVIVLTADHGEEFRDHGGWVHAAKLYDELLRVPLIIKGPGMPQGATVTRQIGLIDLAPTILNLLGIEEKVESFLGTSFLPWLGGDQSKPPNQYVFSTEVHVGGQQALLWNHAGKRGKLYRIRSCRSEEWKYIRDEEGDKQELYHLSLDPKETKNLADREPELTQKFESIMRDQFFERESSMPAAASTTERVFSPQEEAEVVRRLQDLGYF
jgi:arylsulfatase A-like enzyme